MKLATGEKRIQHCGSFCTLMRPGKEVIFASDGNRSDVSSHGIVVDLKYAVFRVPDNIIPLR